MMKKFMILAIIMMLVCLAGCGKQTAKANVNETNVSVDTQIESIVEEILEVYSEDYVENLKYETIAYIEECWEEEGISEDCKDETIELIKSVKYDPSFEYGFDLESLEINFVNILVKYNELPEECYGKNFDQIEEMGVDY